VTHSWLERQLLDLTASAGIGGLRCQVRHYAAGRFVARTDATIADAMFVVEVNGGHAHSTPTQQQRDAQRRNELQLLGWLVLEFTYLDLRDRPAWVVAQIRRALARRIAA
jgi:very-short-patch-repair endonuclease